MEAPSSGSGGPRAGSAAASGAPRAGSGASGGHALALADPEVARFLELIAAEGSGSEPLPRNPLVDELKREWVDSDGKKLGSCCSNDNYY